MLNLKLKHGLKFINFPRRDSMDRCCKRVVVCRSRR